MCTLFMANKFDLIRFDNKTRVLCMCLTQIIYYLYITLLKSKFVCLSSTNKMMMMMMMMMSSFKREMKCKLKGI